MVQPVSARAGTNRKEYLTAFAALAVLTGLELTLIRLPNVARRALISALVLLAVSKATIIGLFFMHLRYETRAMRLTVLIPLLAPGVYALALIADASWRLLR